MAQYIWEKEVLNVIDGGVVFVDGTHGIYTEKQLSYIVTDEPKDPSAFNQLVLNNVTADMFKILIDHDVRKWEIQGIVTSLVWSYNQNFNIAIGKAFWTYEEWKYPEFFPENIRMSDIIRFKNS